MPAPISVIIPTYNCADKLGPCLASLFEGVSAGLICEVILSDGGSDDEIATLADEIGANLIKGKPGRGTQLRTGCAQAKGEWLWVLHADSVLPDGWVNELHRALGSPQKAHFAKLAFDQGGFGPKWVAGWANFRSHFLRLPYGDQGMLIHKTLYKSIGGYADIPLMEDVAISHVLGKRKDILPITITTSFDKYSTDGWFKRGSKNLSLLLRYKLGANPNDLASRYRQTRKSAEN